MNPTLELIFISLTPWLELRGSIPIGIALGMNPLYVFTICTLTNIVVIPLVWIFLTYAVPFFLKIDTLNRLYQKYVVSALKRYEKYRKWEEVGLAIFVGIPLPFTGVWTGTLIAYLLNLNKKEGFLSIAMGAVMAGVIVTALSVGVLKLILGL